MAPPMICCDSGTLCAVVPWLVPDVWLPSPASGVSRLSKGARFCSGRLCAALAATSSACAGLKSAFGIWPAGLKLTTSNSFRATSMSRRGVIAASSAKAQGTWMRSVLTRTGSFRTGSETCAWPYTTMQVPPQGSVAGSAWGVGPMRCTRSALALTALSRGLNGLIGLGLSISGPGLGSPRKNGLLCNGRESCKSLFSDVCLMGVRRRRRYARRSRPLRPALLPPPPAGSEFRF